MIGKDFLIFLDSDYSMVKYNCTESQKWYETQ